MRIFSLDRNQELARGIGDRLSVEMSPLEIRRFGDGEFKVRPLVNVHAEDVYVIATLTNDADHKVHDKICLLLFLIGALKDALASSVTLVAPYMCYARKDQRTKLRDPLTLRYMATLLEAVGLTRVLALDVHNTAAFESAFRIPTDHLSVRDLFARSLAELLGRDDVVLMSPDFGGAKRVQALRSVLDPLRGSETTTLGLVIKERSKDEVKSGQLLGDVRDKRVVIFDDLISSGATASKTAIKCKELGAREVIVAATHALLVGDYAANLGCSAIDRVMVTNSVLQAPGLIPELAVKFSVLDCSRLFAKAIEAMHGRETMVESPEFT